MPELRLGQAALQGAILSPVPLLVKQQREAQVMLQDVLPPASSKRFLPATAATGAPGSPAGPCTAFPTDRPPAPKSPPAESVPPPELLLRLVSALPPPVQQKTASITRPIALSLAQGFCRKLTLSVDQKWGDRPKRSLGEKGCYGT